MFVRQHVTSPEQARAAYERLYARQWLPARTSLFVWVMRLLRPQPGKILLDVACGDAQMGPVARRAGLAYYGIDISYTAVRNACDSETVVGNGTHLPFADNCFDYVTNIGSLEHYLDMAQGIQEMARVLKPDGLACVLVPNAFGLTWNVLRVWRTGDLADDDGQPIQRFGTRGAWHRLLFKNGLQVCRVHGYERALPRSLNEWRPYIVRPGELALALLTPFLPLDLKRCFVFLCAKTRDARNQKLRGACDLAELDV